MPGILGLPAGAADILSASVRRAAPFSRLTLNRIVSRCALSGQGCPRSSPHCAAELQGHDQDSQRLHVVKCLRCRQSISRRKCGEKLRAIDAEFDREMRARGFDPGQV